MAVKYRTGHYGEPLIEEVTIDRETESSVWIDGRRNAKESSWYNFFDTWEAAHAFLICNTESEVLNCRRNLEVASGKLGNIKGLKKS